MSCANRYPDVLLHLGNRRHFLQDWGKAFWNFRWRQVFEAARTFHRRNLRFLDSPPLFWSIVRGLHPTKRWDRAKLLVIHAEDPTNYSPQALLALVLARPLHRLHDLLPSSPMVNQEIEENPIRPSHGHSHHCPPAPYPWNLGLLLLLLGDQG